MVDKVDQEGVTAQKTQRVKGEEFGFGNEALFILIEELSHAAANEEITETGNQGEIVGSSEKTGINAERQQKIGVHVDALHQVLYKDDGKSYRDQHPIRQLLEKGTKEHTNTDAVQNAKIDHKALVSEAQ